MRPIKRTRPTSDGTEPWKDLSFTEPVDSDALHDLLRTQYPGYANLRERKHIAAIEFLQAELSLMQSKEPAHGDLVALPSPDAPSFSSWHTRRGRSSISQSDASSRRLSPSVEPSVHDLKSPATFTDLQAQVTGGSAQQFVFSALDGRTLHPKTKRRMTSKERTAYKQTRKRGACPKCKRQKGKVCQPRLGLEYESSAVF